MRSFNPHHLLRLPVAAAFFALISLLAAPAFADGLGPGGYAAIFWFIIIIFVVGLLFVAGVIALLCWLIFRRRRRA